MAVADHISGCHTLQIITMLATYPSSHFRCTPAHLWQLPLLQAPNYSKIIKQPMDLSTMKSKVERGVYNSWSDLQADLVLMFTNAKTYNAPTTVVHKQADLLLTSGLKMVRNFKQGKTKLRGFTGGCRGGRVAVSWVDR
jgi:hypothetical protein